MWAVPSRDCTTSSLVPISLPRAPLNSVSGSAPHKPWARRPTVGQSFSTVFQGTTPAHPLLRLQYCTHETTSADARVCDGPQRPIASGTPRLWLGTRARPQALADRESSALRASTPLPRPRPPRRIAGPSPPASIHARKSLLRLHASAAVTFYPPAAQQAG